MLGLPAALPANINISNAPDHARWTSSGAVIFTALVDLTQAGSRVVDLPANVRFYPDECGIIITHASGSISQAQISFGNSGDSEALVSDVETIGLDSPHKRQRFKSLNSDDGQQTLSAHVVTAGAGTDYRARFYWRGFAVCTE